MQDLLRIILAKVVDVPAPETTVHLFDPQIDLQRHPSCNLSNVRSSSWEKGVFGSPLFQSPNGRTDIGLNEVFAAASKQRAAIHLPYLVFDKARTHRCEIGDET